MSDPSFKLRHRVLTRFGESDMQGVIFNARYLDYADLAVSVYWMQAGLELFGADMLGFHVVHADLAFEKPMRPFEYVELRCRTERMGNTSVTTRIEIHGEDGEDDRRAVVTIVHVCVDDSTRRLIPISESVRAKLAAFDAREQPLLTGERA